jgi:serine/threonine protein kinase
VSLYDFIERGPTEELAPLYSKFDARHALYEILCGLDYLHAMNIVHRDIKPQNILISVDKTSKDNSDFKLRIVISDFGLCKKLESDETSYNNTLTHGSGTVGWRAPEAIGRALSTLSQSSEEETRTSHRPSKAVDVFSAGVVFFYVLTSGDHPFGDHLSRELNIMEANMTLEKLDVLNPTEAYESKELISRMLSFQPTDRLTSTYYFILS